jgi:uncharacterized cupin superfamily protein
MILGNIDSPVELHAIHGGSGAVLWKVLALGGALFGDLESFEYCRLGPGASFGSHVHSRTEEIYFIVAGSGVVRLDDETYEVGPGDLILTPLDGLHALENTGVDDLELICAEAMPPSIASLLPPQSPTV